MEISLFGEGKKPESAVVTILGGDPHGHNTFDAPDAVKPMDPVTLQAADGKVTVKLPKASVALVEW